MPRITRVCFSPPPPVPPPTPRLSLAHLQSPTPQPLSPSGSPRGYLIPGLRCGVAPGPTPALLHRHRRRRSPAEPVAPASRHPDSVAGSPGRPGSRPAAPRRRCSPRSGVPPPPPAPRPTPCHPAPPARPQPARPGGTAPRRAALRRPSAGQPPGERPAKGSPRAGSERSGAECCAGTPRPTYFVFAPNSLCPGRQPPPRGGRGGPSPPEFTSDSEEGVRHLQPAAGLPSARPGRFLSGRAERDAAVGEPLPRAACQLNGT